MKTNPRYVVRDVDRYGNVRWYFRRRPAGKIRLPAGPDDPSFWPAYGVLLANEPPPRNLVPKPARTAAAAGRGYVYFLRVGERVKIGFSTKPLDRLAQLRTGFPDRVDGFLFIQGTQADERRLHQDLARHRLSGEWFRLVGPVARAMADAAETFYGRTERERLGVPRGVSQAEEINAIN